MQVSLPAVPCSRVCSLRVSACTRRACCLRRAPACTSSRRSWAACFRRAPRYARASALRAPRSASRPRARHRGHRGHPGDRAGRRECAPGPGGSVGLGCARRDRNSGRARCDHGFGMCKKGPRIRGVQDVTTVLGCARRDRALGVCKKGPSFSGMQEGTAILGCADRDHTLGVCKKGP